MVPPPLMGRSVSGSYDRDAPGGRDSRDRAYPVGDYYDDPDGYRRGASGDYDENRERTRSGAASRSDARAAGRGYPAPAAPSARSRDDRPGAGDGYPGSGRPSGRYPGGGPSDGPPSNGRLANGRPSNGRPSNGGSSNGGASAGAAGRRAGGYDDRVQERRTGTGTRRAANRAPYVPPTDDLLDLDGPTAWASPREAGPSGPAEVPPRGGRRRGETTDFVRRSGADADYYDSLDGPTRLGPGQPGRNGAGRPGAGRGGADWNSGADWNGDADWNGGAGPDATAVAGAALLAPDTVRPPDRRERGPGQTDPDGPGAAPGGRRGSRAGAADGGKGAPPGRKVGRRGPMWWRNRPRWLRRLVLLGFLSGFMLFAALIAIIFAMTKVPLPKNVQDSAQSSVITYSDGSTEIARVGTRNRTQVPLSDVSVDAQHAVLAAEDRNFYHEPGISYRGIARALYVDVTGGGVSQGGSTITQQYAKNAYLSQQRTFTRKFTELALAIKLSHQYSKNQILGFYLNTIYFGRGAYGIEAASKAYFGIPAKNLTAEQGAVIAGLIRSPNQLDPRVSPAAATRRWHEVMNTMVTQDWLPAARATSSAVPPTTIVSDNSNGFAPSSDQAAYIRDQVKHELGQAGITEQQIATGGLRVKTTIDKNRQSAAYQAVTSQLQSIYGRVPDLKTGLVAIEPSTGKVLAWYGGTVYGAGANGQTQYVDNVSGAAVPAGSTFKSIVLAAALQKGISLKSVFAAPPVVSVPGAPDVHNDEGDANFGYVDLAEATAQSINTVYVPLGVNQVGVDNIISTARQLGIKADLQAQSGVTLGEDGIPANQMVAVYGAFANGGTSVTPHLVDTVTDSSGKVIYRGPGANSGKKILSSSTDADLTYALQQVLGHGTGTAARLADGRPAAGKTGTTDNFRSAWFCGYTPQLASCVNMFKGQGTTSPRDALRNIPGASSGVYGGTYPAKIWKTFMDAALAGQPKMQFAPPVFNGTVTNQSPSPSPTPATPSPGISIGLPSSSSSGGGPLGGDILQPNAQPSQQPGGQGTGGQGGTSGGGGGGGSGGGDNRRNNGNGNNSNNCGILCGVG